MPMPTEKLVALQYIRCRPFGATFCVCFYKLFNATKIVFVVVIFVVIYIFVFLVDFDYLYMKYCYQYRILQFVKCFHSFWLSSFIKHATASKANFISHLVSCNLEL